MKPSRFSAVQQRAERRSLKLFLAFHRMQRQEARQVLVPTLLVAGSAGSWLFRFQSACVDWEVLLAALQTGSVDWHGKLLS